MKMAYNALNYKYYELFGSAVKMQAMEVMVKSPASKFSTLEISKETGLPQSSLSQALTSLEAVGLLESKEEGKFKFYKIKKHFLQNLSEIYKNFEQIHERLNK